MGTLTHITRFWRCGLFAAIAVAAAWLTWQGVTVGDDMGYLFADTRLHAGDGPRVESIAQVFSTQCSHFLHFNGRFLIHSLTQVFLMEGMRWVYVALNALMLALLWLGLCRLIGGRHFGAGTASLTLCMMLMLMPAPGVIWLSLVAFATNYLWPAVLMVWLLVWLRQRLDCGQPLQWWLPALAVLQGALQESFSLPLIGALGLAWLLNRKQKPYLWMALAMLAGAIALLVAPGNYAHASAGGGFSLSVIGHKTLFMLRDSLRTPLPWLAALAAVMACFPRTRTLLKLSQFDRMLLMAIICALLLGVLSYTAVRQLVAPSLLACVLIGQWLIKIARNRPATLRKALSCCGLLLCAVLIAGALAVRGQTQARMNYVLEKAKTSRVIFSPSQGAIYNTFWIYTPLGGMDDDPFRNDLLHIVYDFNTRKGIKRLQNPKAKGLPEIIPVSITCLHRAMTRVEMGTNPLAKADSLRLSAANRKEGTAKAYPLDQVYSLVVTRASNPLPNVTYVDGSHMPFAAVTFADTLCLIVPSDAEIVRLSSKKKKQ